MNFSSKLILLPLLGVVIDGEAQAEVLDQMLTGVDCQVAFASRFHSVDEVGEFATLHPTFGNVLFCFVQTNSPFGVVSRPNTITRAVALMQHGNVTVCFSDRWGDTVQCGMPVLANSSMSDKFAFPPSSLGWSSDDQVFVVIEWNRYLFSGSGRSTGVGSA